MLLFSEHEDLGHKITDDIQDLGLAVVDRGPSIVNYTMFLRVLSRLTGICHY